MRRTYRVPFSRAGLVGLMAALVLLCLPGTSIAGGASDTSSASQARQALLQYGAGYGKADGAPQVRTIQRTLRRLGWQPGPVDGLYGPGQRPLSPASNQLHAWRPTASSARRRTRH